MDQPHHKRKGEAVYSPDLNDLGLTPEDFTLGILKPEGKEGIGIFINKNLPLGDTERVSYYLYCAIVEVSALAAMQMKGNSAENTSKMGREIIARLNMLSFTDPGKGVPGSGGIEG